MELKNVLETIKTMVEGQDKINNNNNKTLLLISERLDNLEKRVNEILINQMMDKTEK